MKRLPLLLALLSAVALADIPPSNASQCQGASAGGACTTDDGKAGTCVMQKVGRLDYSEGVPPKSIEVDMLICVASASARVATAPPYLAAGLVLLIMGALLAVKVFGRGRRLQASS
jgi:hypothetical protein